MNNNTKARKRIERKEGKHFHGSCCDTGHGAPANRRITKHDYSTVVQRAKTGGVAQ